MTDLEKKLWKRVNRYVGILRIVPFVRMVAICNNLAFSMVDDKSDIDLFIVAKKGRLFTVRILVTLLFHVLGVRRHGRKVAGRFCLSFFVDDSALDLSGIALEGDIYLAFWIASMKPVIDDGVYGEFLDANSWIKEYFDEPISPDYKYTLSNMSFLKRLFEWFLNGRIGDFFENRMSRWQIARASKKALSAGDDANLIVEEHILKFHNIDRRREYRSLWFDRYGEAAKLSREKFSKLID
ncbi:MAG: hypothetical protein O3B47_03935 [bacterium]|nr:hypothetical protein [bacterium]